MKTTYAQKDDNLVLAASAARTTELTGTGIAIGPTGLCEAVVIVTALAATPTITPHIQQSSDDGSVDAYADVAVGPDISAVGIYRIPFRATEKYVRAFVEVADADSITYEIFVTRKGE